MAQQDNYPKLQPARNLLVCLDLTDIDSPLIRYADFAARSIAAERVTFIHAIQAYDLPDKRGRNFPDVETELDGMIRNEIHQYAEAHFKHGCRWEVATRVGHEDAAQEIVEFIENNHIDLTLIGQKAGENREARYGKKITAEGKSDILFVPSDHEQGMDPILCAIDCSEESKRAFERALDLSRAWSVTIRAYYLSDPGRAYFPATTNRSAGYYQRQAKKAYESYLADYELTPRDIPCRIEPGNARTSEAENVYQEAQRIGAKLIIAGARGDTGSVTSLLGNLSEGLRIMEKDIPVMIVKGRGEKKWYQVWR
jgi:nucleotide-binding universal stress UspA family protein